MKQGLGLMALAAALVVASLWMSGNPDVAVDANSGPTAIAACVAAIVGAVLMARSLMNRKR